MQTFHYTALDKNGKTHKGALQAETLVDAQNQLRSRALAPLDIKAASNKNIAAHFTLAKPVTPSDTALFTRQLATLIGAGAPITTALTSLTTQVNKPALKTVVTGIRSGILGGMSLAQALGQYPEVFSTMYCATVMAGEQTGKLDVILERLADHTEQQQEMKQKLQQAAIYPFVMLLVSLSVVAFLLSYVVPNMIQVFADTRQVLPLVTRILIALSDGITVYGIWAAVGLVLLIISAKHALKKPKYRYQFDAGLLKLPLLGRLTRLANTSRYARTFGMLTNAGLPALESITIATQLITNKPMFEAMTAATRHVREGTPIHYALQETGYFSPLSVQLISSGENTGQLGNMLERCATYQESEIKRFLDTLLSLFEPIIIVVMGFIVLFIVVAIMLPIFSMNTLVG